MEATEKSNAFFTAGPEPAAVCRLFFVLAAAGVVAASATPPSARRLLTQYGARRSVGGLPPSSKGRERDEPAATDRFTRLIGRVTSRGRVPHSWFVSFYLLSVSSSVFWAIQYACHGSLLSFIARRQVEQTGSSASMTIHQVALTWFLLLGQATRRLYECVAIVKPSSSEMWVVHWLLGSAYYLVMGVSVWVEGSASLLVSQRHIPFWTLPSMRTVSAAVVFGLAWWTQYRCHKHLASLKKYSLPEEGMFRYLICPHYTCECLVYSSLAVLAAPKDQLYNKTLVCGFLFVSANLGVTAHGTYTWYAERFGKEKVRAKWRMVPFVY